MASSILRRHMCGIDGIIVYGEGPPVTREALVAMGDAQRHRGPDDEGQWISPDGRTGLGHRRLSIVDLSPSGHQPMSTRDGRYHIVFNGEIYNYQALRRELEAAGHVFESTSDTETLLHGYREWGVSLLDRLRGMFAFALYDAETRETFLARDSLGIKPLYYADDGSRLVFASEVQAIRRVIDQHDIDPEGLASFLCWGSIAPPRTLHRAIRALPPAASMIVRPGRVEAPEVYYRLEDEFGSPDKMDEHEAAEAVRTALVDSVRHHMIADVPVGSFLSGGVDSSSLVGLMAEIHDGPIRTITLSMDDEDLDEASLAQQAADLYATDHHVIATTIEAARARIPDAIRSLDQPSIDGINTYLVSEATVKAGLKVAVSGVGGDELFGGYGTFQSVPAIEGLHRRMGALPGGAHAMRLVANLASRVPRSTLQARSVRVLGYGADTAGAYFANRGLFAPEEVRQLLAPEYAEAVEACDPRRELNERVLPGSLPEEERISALELRQYMQCQLLRDTDATAMRHSLEVRLPLVDRELLRAAARVPAVFRHKGPAKFQLRNSARPPVPDALWARKKQGFALPFENWLRSGFVDTTLPEHPLLAPHGLERLRRDFEARRVSWSRIWALIVLREYLH
ncbi:MAG: asparagine synthase (glutamine-hydrolyzing) [Myxococcota bacterium]|nr:asparagine synthase (glutamine-hydrolyzing) [Myxococcota bacterium]